MAYALHIERPDGAIALEEWHAAVEATAGVRLASAPVRMTNPETGQVIDLGINPGDAEVMCASGGLLGLAAKREWRPILRFSHGRATFRAPDDFDNPKNPARRAAAALASHLEAVIVGDEGEEYHW